MRAKMIIAMFVYLSLGVAAWGIVVWQLWNWYVVPLGLPNITPIWAMGLCLLAFTVTSGHTHEPMLKMTGRPVDLFRILTVVMDPAAFLALGWALHWGMP